MIGQRKRTSATWIDLLSFFVHSGACRRGIGVCVRVCAREADRGSRTPPATRGGGGPKTNTTHQKSIQQTSAPTVLAFTLSVKQGRQQCTPGRVPQAPPFLQHTIDLRALLHSAFRLPDEQIEPHPLPAGRKQAPMMIGTSRSSFRLQVVLCMPVTCLHTVRRGT